MVPSSADATLLSCESPAPCRPVEFRVLALHTEADSFGIHLVADVDCRKQVSLVIPPALFEAWAAQTFPLGLGKSENGKQGGRLRRWLGCWRRGLPFLAVAGCLLLVAGCASGPAFSYWKPWTWVGSHATAKVDAAFEAYNKASADAVKAAQVEVHKAGIAVAAAPQEDKAVEVTGRFVYNAGALLGTAAGPLPIDTQKDDQQLVRDLIAGKAAAERKQADVEDRAAKLSAHVASLEARLDAAQASLKAGYEQEHALANELRRQEWYKWGGVALSTLLGVAVFYFKFSGNAVGAELTQTAQKLSDTVKGVGGAIADAKQAGLANLEDFVTHLDVNLGPEIQAMIKGHKQAAIAQTAAEAATAATSAPAAS